MAANEVVVKFKLDADGNLKALASDADRAAGATERLSGSRDKYSRKEKGVAAASANTTKNFSKMQQGMQNGLVPAYAALAANIFALTALFGALQRAAQVKQLEEGLLAMGAASGQALGQVSRGLQESTGFALSLEEAMRSTALITSAGLDSSSIEEFGKAARNASLALGRNTAESLERFTRGVTKLEPELLDELGIFVRVDKAAEDYARSIGKSANELTNFEKRQAFANAALTQAETKFGALEGVDVSAYDKLSASFTDLSKTMLNFINIPVGAVVGVLAENTGLLLAVMLRFAASISGDVLGSLGEMAKRSKQTAEAQLKMRGAAGSLLQTLARSDNGYRKLGKALEAGTAEQKHFDAALKTNTRSMASANAMFQSGANNRFLYTRKLLENRLALHEINKVQTLHAFNQVLVREGDILNALEANKYTLALKLLKQQFVDVTEATKVAAASTGLFSKVLNISKVAALTTASAFRVLGGAISKLLGPISLFLIVWEVLTGVVKFFYEGLTTDEFSAFRDQVNKTEEVISELGASFLEVDKAASGQSASLQTLTQVQIAYGNALGSVAKELRDLQAIQSDGFFFFNEQASLVTDLMDQSDKFSKAMFEAGHATKFFGMTIVNNVPAALELMEAEKRAADQTKNIKESMDVAAKSTQDFLNSFKKTTALDQAADGLGDLEKAITSATSVTEKQAIISQQLEENELLSRLVAAQQGANDEERIKNLTKIIKDQQQSIALSKIRIDIETAGLNILKAQNIQSTEAFEARAAAQNEIIKLQKEGLKAEIAATEVAMQGAKEGSIERLAAEKQLELLKIRLLELNEKIITQADITLQTVTLTVGREKETLDLLQKQVNARKKGVQASLKLAQSLLAIEGARTGGGVSIENQIALSIAAAETNFALEKKSLDFRVRVINAEQRLLTAQEDARRAELRTIISTGKQGNATPQQRAAATAAEAEEAALNDVSGLREETIRVLIQSLTIETSINKILADNRTELLKQQKSRQEINNAIDKSLILTDKATSLGGQLGANAFLQLSMQKQISQALADAKTEGEETVKGQGFLNDATELQNDLLLNNIETAQEFAKTLMESFNAIAKINVQLLQTQNSMDELANTNPFTGEPISLQKAAKIADKEKLLQLEAAKVEAEIKKANIDFEAHNIALRFMLLEAELNKMKVERQLTVDERALIDRQVEANRTIIQNQTAVNDKRKTLIDKELELLEKKTTNDRLGAIAAAAKGADKGRGAATGFSAALAVANPEGMGLSPDELAQMDAASQAAVEYAKSLGELGRAGILVRGTLQGMAEDFKALGPEGAGVAMAIEGGIAIFDSFQILADSTKDVADRLFALGGVIAGMAEMQAGASKQKVAQIDNEIKAEKNRDGQTQQSLNKISQLEKKKEQEKRKAFEDNKKMQIAQTIVNTAASVSQMMSSAPFPLNFALAAMALAMGMKQLAIIKSTQYSGSGGLDNSSPTTVSAGSRRSTVDVAQSQGGAGELSYFRGERGVGGPEDFTPAFSGYRNRAEGGNTAFMVGEQGPEMFIPDRAGTIIPNDDIVAPTAVNATFNISTVDATGVEDLLTNQRGNIIDMIREAANANGEEFLETIRTSEL